MGCIQGFYGSRDVLLGVPGSSLIMVQGFNSCIDLSSNSRISCTMHSSVRKSPSLTDVLQCDSCVQPLLEIKHAVVCSVAKTSKHE